MKLFVVMPAYNEEPCVEAVIDEWIPALRQVTSDFVFAAIDDGSRDGTLAALRALAARYPELRVITKANSGHGQTCVFGYRQALEAGAEWVLQIDSDGQCDPRFFPALWAASASHPVVYGFRRHRDDGLERTLISRAVSGVALVSSRTWVRDANVPYRLMHRSSLEDAVDEIPGDFHLANVLLAVLQCRNPGIAWVDIRFRNRIGGTPKVKGRAFAKHGRQLFVQLWKQRHR